MVELINAKCPNCGANLELPHNLEMAYCVYCGSKIIIEKKGDKHIHYHVSEAMFTCEGCGMRKTFKEYSGVEGYHLCMDCYYRDENSSFKIWVVGIVLVFLSIIPFIVLSGFLKIVGAIFLILGVILIGIGKILAP